MKTKTIDEYINELKDLESFILNDDEKTNDPEFVMSLDKLLTTLSNDIKDSYTNPKLQIKVKKLSPNAVIPIYAKDGDAGMDLTAISVEYSYEDGYYSYKTGLAIEIPNGYVGLLFPRSSNSKKDLLLSNSVGVIDSGYRGEIELRFKPILNNKTENISKYNVGDRVGQIMIIPYPKIEFIETNELSDSDRGENGFGSTN